MLRFAWELGLSRLTEQGWHRVVCNQRIPGICRGCSSFAGFFSKISDAFHVLFDPLANHIEGLFLRFGGHLREFSHVSQGLFETLFGEIRALLYGFWLASIVK